MCWNAWPFGVSPGPGTLATMTSTEDDSAVSDSEECETTIELSRPVPAPDPVKQQQFQQKVASTPLGSTSDGLLALLRDHPELVSTKLAAAAERNLPDETVTAPRVGSSTSSYAQALHEGGNVTSTLFPNQDMVLSPSLAPTTSMSRGSSQYSLPDMAMATLSSVSDPTIHTSVLKQSSKKKISRSMSISRNLGEQSHKPDHSEKLSLIHI